MTKTTNPRWTNPTRLPDGHRLFQATEPYEHNGMANMPLDLLFDKQGMWAIADDSGGSPDETDDGLLWLDFNRDLMAGAPATQGNPAHVPSIPLLDTTGSQCSTVTDTCTLLVLSVKFDWAINVLGTAIQARKI